MTLKPREARSRSRSYRAPRSASRAAEVYSANKEKVVRLIEADETARDVIAITGRRTAYRQFERLLDDVGYFAQIKRQWGKKRDEDVWQQFFASRTSVEPPEWGDRLDGFRTCGAAELPAGFLAGWRYVAPVLEMPTYLAYLERRLAQS